MQSHRRVVIQPLHACAGVLCPSHLDCARYAWVDGSDEPSVYWLANCAPPDANYYPGFIDVAFVGPPEPRPTLITRRGAFTAALSRRRPVYALVAA